MRASNNAPCPLRGHSRNAAIDSPPAAAHRDHYAARAATDLPMMSRRSSRGRGVAGCCRRKPSGCAPSKSRRARGHGSQLVWEFTPRAKTCPARRSRRWRDLGVRRRIVRDVTRCCRARDVPPRTITQPNGPPLVRRPASASRITSREIFVGRRSDWGYRRTMDAFAPAMALRCENQQVVIIRFCLHGCCLLCDRRRILVSTSGRARKRSNAG